MSASPEASALPASGEDVHGLVFAFVPSDQTSVDYDVLDAATGELTWNSSFTMPDGARPAAPLAYALSPDLRYTAAMQDQPDGTRHAGWAGKDGSFTDVSTALAGGDSFAGGKTSDRAAFIGDRFYFNLRSASSNASDAIYSIADTAILDGSSGGFRKEPVAQPADDDAIPTFGPDGTITKQTNGCRKAYGAWAFYPGGYLKSSFLALRHNTIEKFPLRSSCEIGFGDGTALLPESDQAVTQLAVSPDRTTVAFVAKRGTVSTIYTVAGAGGEPKRISESDSSANVLVTWR